jgi:hypothetical protein
LVSARVGIEIEAVYSMSTTWGAKLEKFYFNGRGVDYWAAPARYRDSNVPTSATTPVLSGTKPGNSDIDLRLVMKTAMTALLTVLSSA